jgi:hypothetical protein
LNTGRVGAPDRHIVRRSTSVSMNGHAPKVYRGSKKRIRRIRMRGNGSLALWVFVALVLFMLCVALPWLILHTHSEPAISGNVIHAR